ncbi:MAG TPA: hypothetical protein VH144_01400 [Candidatus Saccharimonadales bacterium]|jgi:A/G-specific adenine glycosylase|nr:hypothetical protein [Candidatus Saccharimonadales bacterium]
MLLTPLQIQQFTDEVWAYYHDHARTMPWREDTQPYAILVSELMLQQTQVARVIPKFEAFITAFPTIEALASAPLSKVLQLWNGLGYNRRAKFLWQASQHVIDNCGGEMPSEYATLLQLPGVGPNTAGAILAYAYNQPVVFVETNIRTVYFHHFFANQSQAVHDSELKVLLEQTVDHEHPREWYWAVMDYGAYLKSHTGGHLQTSQHYSKQSKFEGSLRQMRGAIIRALSSQPYQQYDLQGSLGADNDPRFASALESLTKEQLVTLDGKILRLTDH